MKVNSHYITLEQYRKTAGFSRSCLFPQVDGPGACVAPLHALGLTNIYKIRYRDCADWISAIHPDDSAVEWLYFDKQGLPAIYWNLESNSLILI